MIPIIQTDVEEMNYFLNYLTEHIPEYKLSELTNSYMGDIPNIIMCHPLAVEYGNMLNIDEKGNYTSVLPAIGVELTNDNESSQQFLGSAQMSKEVSEVTIDDINNIEVKDRFSNGIILSDSNLNSIKTMKTQKGVEKLWSKKSTYLQDVQMAISIWSDNFVITRILYIVVGDLLKRAKHDVSTLGIKNLKISGQGAIYNWEFHMTLYGAEYTLSFLNKRYTQLIDDSLVTIKTVEESILSNSANSKPTFKP
jgi:hypothetical protein